MRRPREGSVEEIVAEPYPLEGSSVSDELEDNLAGDPRAGSALLRSSGMWDWSSEEYARIDGESPSLDGCDVIPVRRLFDYVMDNYCTYSPDTIERKYLAMSLMLSLNHGVIRMYRLGFGYRNEVRFLRNVFVRLLSGVTRGGLVVIRDKF